MHYYKATIQYDGTGYAGFQWQNNAPSIQNDFNQAIKKIISGKLTTMGASRTDTGVHAMEQVVKISSEKQLDCQNFLSELKKNLPPQINCLEIISCPWDFYPASDPLSKEYRYFFTNQKIVLPDKRRFIANFSLRLDIESMKKCVREIPGTHNFHNFFSAGSNVKSTIRTISFCELTEINPHSLFNSSELFSIPNELKNCYQLKIEGNGFLKQMIRHLVSALWMVGSGAMTSDHFLELLHGEKKEKRLWKVAAPNGLFLYKIEYPHIFKNT